MDVALSQDDERTRGNLIALVEQAAVYGAALSEAESTRIALMREEAERK